MRRARGYVPRPLAVDRPFARPVLACGAQLKNTFCVGRANEAVLGPHIGDLENVATFEAYGDAIARLERFLDVRPDVVAHDMHPDYLSTTYALGRGAERHVRRAAPPRARGQRDGGARPRRTGDGPRVRRHRLRHGRHVLGRRTAHRGPRGVHADRDVPADSAGRRRSGGPAAVARRARAASTTRSAAIPRWTHCRCFRSTPPAEIETQSAA